MRKRGRQGSNWVQRVIYALTMLAVIFGVMFFVVRPIMTNVLMRGISP